jgi:hypothetical protein
VRGLEYDASKDTDRIAAALLGLLTPQIRELGFKLETVPTLTMLTSAECCGYLYGLSCGVLLNEQIKVTRDSLIDTLIAAFALVFGDVAGRPLAQRTFDEVATQNPIVSSASDWAIREVNGVYESGENNALGFYLAASGMLS